MTFRDVEVRDAVMRKALRLGLFLTGAGESSIRLMPPLTIERDELEEAVKIRGKATRNIK